MMYLALRFHVATCWILLASPALAFTQFQSIACNGIKSETGDDGEAYGYQLVRTDHGTYRVRHYYYGWTNPAGHTRRPYGEFERAELNCTFSDQTEGEIMNCSSSGYKRCVVLTSHDSSNQRGAYYRVETAPLCDHILGSPYNLPNAGCEFH